MGGTPSAISSRWPQVSTLKFSERLRFWGRSGVHTTQPGPPEPPPARWISYFRRRWLPAAGFAPKPCWGATQRRSAPLLLTLLLNDGEESVRGRLWCSGRAKRAKVCYGRG